LTAVLAVAVVFLYFIHFRDGVFMTYPSYSPGITSGRPLFSVSWRCSLSLAGARLCDAPPPVRRSAPPRCARRISLSARHSVWAQRCDCCDGAIRVAVPGCF
jgi:hypothetical protein